MTEVVNIKHCHKDWQNDPNYIYIGRANKNYNVKQSKWHNPFIIGKDGDRDEVLKKYDKYFWDNHLLNDIDELKDKILVCWCKPERCHGDLLAQYADGVYF